jgi:hypothetical protein
MAGGGICANYIRSLYGRCSPFIGLPATPEEFNQLYRSSHHGVSWGAMALFLFFFILGIGFLAKPLILLDKLSPRKLSDEPDVRPHLHKLQIFGGILIFISLFGISIQLVRYLQR